MNLTPHDIIIAPRISEKAVYQKEKLRGYTFQVNPHANKVQIREAVEKLFNVKVEKVTTRNRHHKIRRAAKGIVIKRPVMKIALVTLVAGQTIEGM